MSTYTRINKIEREIAKLNEVIDLRIIRGQSYKVLSRKHKTLMDELRALKRQEKATSRSVRSVESNWSKTFFTRLSQYASVFLM